ncbi:MAG: hypothetical protein CVT49_15190 [candidate division Zixibacteria bacterium HGW-Zixibacteria-1]|nr:MAG: hypothetical protein CVT49_15190 [candidate division Zixibacteria bacterium HGW-Zixibacteria-1]
MDYIKFSCKACGYEIIVDSDNKSYFITCRNCQTLNAIPQAIVEHRPDNAGLRKKNNSLPESEISISKKKEIYKRYFPIACWLGGFMAFIIYLNIKTDGITVSFQNQNPLLFKLIKYTAHIGILLVVSGIICIAGYLYIKCARPGKIIDPFSILYYKEDKIQELVPIGLAIGLIVLIEIVLYLFK